MANVRLIARLDVKGANLIKGIHLEGLRIVGDPQVHTQNYYAHGIDEIIYMDAVASLYGRNHLTEIVKRAANEVFIPMTVGGGIRSADDVTAILHAGADKVAINTAAIQNPRLIKEVAEKFGSQCMVLSIEAKKVGENRWEAYTENGRERTGKDVVEWACRAEELGAGEILLTSVDQEGTRKGFDLELTRRVSTAVSIPVIASGGMGDMDHLRAVVQEGKADAVAMADVLHYNRLTIEGIKRYCIEHDIPVRKDLA